MANTRGLGRCMASWTHAQPRACSMPGAPPTTSCTNPCCPCARVHRAPATELSCPRAAGPLKKQRSTVRSSALNTFSMRFLGPRKKLNATAPRNRRPPVEALDKGGVSLPLQHQVAGARGAVAHDHTGADAAPPALGRRLGLCVCVLCPLNTLRRAVAVLHVAPTTRRDCLWPRSGL